MKLAPINNTILALSLICFAGINIFIPSYFNGFSFTTSISIYELFDNNGINQILLDRSNDVVFSKRIVVTSIVTFLSTYLFLPNQFSLSLIYIFSLVSIYFSFKNLAEKFNVKDYVKLSFCLFLLHYPILFATSSLMSGFDDLLQFALLLAAFNLSQNHKYKTSAFLFLLALLVRETSVFLAPLFILDHSRKHFLIKLKHILLYLLSIVLFLFFFLKISNNQASFDFIQNTRFTAFDANFHSFYDVVRSSYSIFLSLFFPLYIIRQSILNYSSKIIFLIRLQFAVIGFYTMLACFSSLISESRILALPLIFLFPFVGASLHHYINNREIRNNLLMYSIIFFISLPIIYHICYHYFIPHNFRSKIIYQSYAFLYISIIVSNFIFLKNKISSVNV